MTALRECLRSNQNYSIVITEILPLVEFYPESDINDTEVERLLMAPPKPNMGHSDPFADTMIHEDITDTLPLTLDRDALRAVDPISVLIVKWPKPLKTKYYRNLLPELQISICPECLQVICVFLFSTDIRSIESLMVDFYYLAGIPF